MITGADSAKPKPALYKTLYFQVIAGIILGIAFGYVFPERAVAMKPLADGFIKLIKMLIPLVIFCTVTSGIAGMRNMKNAGRVGLKALVYFEAMTTVALLMGIFIMHVWQPGAAMHVDPATLDVSAVTAYAGEAIPQTVPEFLLKIIPNTISDAFDKGDMLQVLLVSVLVAGALMSLRDRAYHISQLVQQMSDVLFSIVSFVVRLAPLGAFGAMAFTIGKYGIGSLGALLNLMLGFYTTCVLFILLGLGAVMRLLGLRILPFLGYIKDEIFIVLGTSSSEAALPRLIDKLIVLGCSRPLVDMVVPTGYSFNLDGTSIYLTMAALFIAQALGIHLTAGEELTMLGILLLTSKGAAGVTGSGFVVLAGSLSAVGHIPVAGLALIFGIDRFMSEARAITNLVGNGVGTLVVARWERAIDMQRAKQTLDIG
ncbi:MAG: C4-dicarboxylate transporter DctA [Pseudomonadota bacterium]|nr:C4-dicarboxylate transporter DctA [Pseudomonadota bacterium]